VKRIAILISIAAAFLVPAVAQAHPLGNFTINRFARVEVSGQRLYVRYVLDLAEIPTYQARQHGVDPQAYASRIAQRLHVTLDGRRVALQPVAHALAFPRGVAGLHTMRLEVILRGPAVAHAESVAVRDTNYADHLGWREIVVGADTTSLSKELHAYPKSLLESPLDTTSLNAVLVPTSDPVPRVSRTTSLEAPDRIAESGFTRLIGHGHLSALVILFSLAAALFWGAAHALSPGHGKTIVTAYLVGTRGTPRHAALLGLVTTVTHTIGVFALGGVTLALSAFIVPETLYPWINVVAGLLVVIVGIVVLTGRWRSGHSHTHGAHGHSHGEHNHGAHGQSHDHQEPPQSTRGLVAVGISGGLLPCPSALVVLLAAISLHRVAFGMLLIVAFSFGLAISITGIGLIAVVAKRAFRKLSMDSAAIRFLPAVSALVIVLAGVVMTARAVPGLRI
jgi:ABC-type nickel/cobalt efflux system permease component RcnA